ncbi:MAG: MFS transporter [Rhizobiales bacterium]|nr:MFS transporter [Hyphomicrobiales bacterium]
MSPASADPNANAKRNALILSVALAFNGAGPPIAIAFGGLAGFYMLGADKSLATAPVTGYSLGVATATLPAAMLMGRIGRRYGFMTGALGTLFGMAICGWALTMLNFWLFAIGMMLIGVGNAFVHQYRFAAADQGNDAFKPKAISWVLVGGIGAAIIGPQLAIGAKDLMLPVQFAGAFFAGMGLPVIGILILSFLKFDAPMSRAEQKLAGTGRPITEIITQPRFMVSVLCAVGSYALMSFVMTGAPLAMVGCGISIENATLGIQWHVIAMFAPSFFTGNLIVRFGKEKIVIAGLLILAACASVGLLGLELWNFWLGLVLLGIGWNFGFIGATTMLTETYRPEEKSKAQGANDFLLFGCVAFASLMSGQVLNAWGWDAVNMVVFPVVAVCLVSLCLLVWSQRRKPTP